MFILICFFLFTVQMYVSCFLRLGEEYFVASHSRLPQVFARTICLRAVRNLFNFALLPFLFASLLVCELLKRVNWHTAVALRQRYFEKLTCRACSLRFEHNLVIFNPTSDWLLQTVFVLVAFLKCQLMVCLLFLNPLIFQLVSPTLAFFALLYQFLFNCS